MKKMNRKNKILLANMLTVVFAVLTLLSFSAMQGFSLVTIMAILAGIYFAKVTFSFVKLEDVLRKRASNIKFRQVVSYQQTKPAKAA